MNHSPDISAAMEDYLEAIFRLIAEKGAARVGDIASALAVHKSTVTGALKKLAQAGLVSYSPYERTTLTATGRQAAQRIAQRHATIKDVLVHVFGSSAGSRGIERLPHGARSRQRADEPF